MTDVQTEQYGQPDDEIIEFKDTHCDHYFFIDRTDVKCKNCQNGWPGLAKYVTITDGKIASVQPR